MLAPPGENLKIGTTEMSFPAILVVKPQFCGARIVLIVWQA